MDKAPEAFRTIREVAEELDVPQHVLRFWESRFHDIRPMKRGGGRRYYRPEDLDLLRGIRHLLYAEGYTIRGVQRILREQGVRFVQTVWQPGAVQPTREPADLLGDEAGVHRPVEAEPPSIEAVEADARAPDAAEAEPIEEPVVPLAARPPIAAPVQAAPRARPAERLSAHGIETLRAALAELTECRRLLDAGRGDGR